MADYICRAKGCHNKADVLIAGCDICDSCQTRVFEELGSIKAENSAWLKRYAKFLKTQDREIVLAMADSGSDNEECTKEAPIMTVKKKPAVRKKAAVRKSTAKKKVAKKTVKKREAKPVTKGSRKREEGAADFQRRSLPIDNVAEQLLECKTVSDMHEIAIAIEGINKEKLAAAMADFKNGGHPGLIRMRIGNLCRGALRRAKRT